MSGSAPFRRAFASQVGWYLVVGAIGFVADALAYWIFAHAFGWSIVPARLAAFVPATLVTWAINRRYTFARDGDGDADAGHGPLWQYLKYLAVQGGGIVVSFITFHSLVGRYAGHDMLALAAGSIVALVFNFAGSRLIVFTGRKADASPLLVAAFGALSVAMGQDANWDLANYHLYNAYALLEGRLHIDLAAAGLQSYFNPLLDLPYYALTMSLPAPAVAFVMGCVHGVAALLVAGIARTVLPQASTREVWLLAIAGCLGATFLSELGNSMGDNTTALLVLGALAICLRAMVSATVDGAQKRIVVAGLLVGAACGLKLTNASFAIGLAAAFAVCEWPWRERARGAMLLTAGGVVGLVVVAGWWWWRMWVEFGNPLFPQFNSVFGSPMAGAMGVADPRWGPRGIGEALVYPFVFLWEPKRVGETPLVQVLWGVGYGLFVGAGVRWVVGVMKGVGWTKMPPPQPSPEGGGRETRALLMFVAVSYLVWLGVFGILRYAVAIEVLLPLCVWLLLPRVWPQPAARKVARCIIVAAVVISVVPFKTWGHASFADRSYAVPSLPIAQPQTATVIFLAQPVAWMVAFLPRELAFVSLFNFPESPAYVQRAKAIVAQRGGEVWAVLPAAADTAANTVAHFNDWASRHGIAADGLVCRATARGLRLSTRYRDYLPQPGGACRFEQPAALRRDLDAENRRIAGDWAGQLATRGLALDAASCRRYEAFIGELPQPFQFCRVAR